jgi:hypothetical protein
MSMDILYYYDGDWAAIYEDGLLVDQDHISTIREAALERLGVGRHVATDEQERVAEKFGSAPDRLP